MKVIKITVMIFALQFLISGCYLFPIDDNTRFFALIIGINDYEDTGVTDLNYCVFDATDIKNSLIDNGWNEDEIVFLTNSALTKSAILNTLVSFVDQAEKNDYILVYYSGHGTVLEDLNGDESDGIDEVIVPVDYEQGNNSTLILDDTLGEIFSDCKTEKGIFIFDSCNSGGFINKFLNYSNLNARFTESGSVKGTATNGDLDITQFPVLAASGQYEYAYENSFLQHGVFTYFILEALSGLRADKDNDGFITIRELFDYAVNQTESYLDYYYGFVSQHPQLRYPREFLDILVTR